MQQLHAVNEAASIEPSKSSMDSAQLCGQRINFETTQKPLSKDAALVIPNANANANINVHAQTSTQEARNTETNSVPTTFNSGNHSAPTTFNSGNPASSSAFTSGIVTNTVSGGLADNVSDGKLLS